MTQAMRIGVEITGNSAGAVKAAREAQAAIDAMTGATEKAGAAASRSATGLAQAERAAASTTGSVVRLRDGFAGLGGGAVQNVAFQLGDFATQVGSGTAASIALGQQLPQLLGGFGPLGAVMGAVVAVGVPLAAAFLSAGQEADSLSDRADDLTDAAERLSDALAAVGQANEDLVGKFGRNAQAMREVLAMQAGLAQADFGEKMRAQADAMSEVFGDLGGRLSESWAAAGWTQAEVVLGNVRGALDATAPAAQEVVDRIAALGAAEGPEQTAQAALDMSRAMAEAAGGAQNLTGDALELYRTLLLTATAGFDTAAALAAAGTAAAGAAQSVHEASEVFRRYLEYSEAFDKDALARKTAPLAATEDGRNVQDRGVLLTQSDRAGLPMSDPRNPNYRNYKPPKSGGGGGRSSAASEAARGREAIDGMIASLRSELDVMRETDPVQQELIRLRERMTYATAGQRETVEGLVRTQISETAATEAQVARMDNLRAAASDAFGSMRSAIEGASSAGEVLGSVLGSLGDRLINLGSAGLFDILFGKQGDASGGILGGVISSILPFAQGGVVDRPHVFGLGAGRLGLMGEAGPEAIMPLSSGMVGARLGGRETRLPLTRLSSGNLGVSVTPFAKGGVVSAGPLALGAGVPAESSGAQRVRIELALSPDLVSRLLEETDSRAEIIVTRAEKRFDAGLPAKVRKIGRDPSNMGGGGRGR